MIAICPATQPGAAFVRRMLDFVDCQAQAIGAGGYQALAAPGSMLSLVLTGLLTIFVALIGYRMLFGQGPSVRDGVLALVKIGVVLALATSWTAYRTLVYDVALKGPAELAADISRPAGLPGAGGGLVGRLAYSDRLFELLAIAGTGAPATPAVATQPQQQPTPDMFPGFSTFALGGARVAFLTAAIGALAAVRLIAGLLLALGPFFIAFLLFDSTRGLFEGWVRGLAGAALGAVGTAVALGVELALIEPWLAELLSRRYAGQPIPGAPAELLVATLLFGLVLVVILYASARVALGFRMHAGWRGAPAQIAGALRGGQVRVAGASAEAAIPAASRSRSVAVADAVAASQRRESAAPRAVAGAGAAAGAPSRTFHQGPTREPSPTATAPLGQSFRRRTTSRVSASAGRRDHGS